MMGTPLSLFVGLAIAVGTIPQNEKPLSPRVNVFLAPDRIEVIPPSTPLKLAEENELSLRIKSPGAVMMATEQAQYAPQDAVTRLIPSIPHGSYADLPIQYRDDGTAFIKIIPRRLGTVVFSLRAHFPDGGLTKVSATLTVEPPARSPKRLIVGHDGTPTSTPTHYSYLYPDTDKGGLSIFADYDNLKEEVTIDPSFVRFKVRTANGASIIKINKSTGRITPLQLGEALVETRFGGLKNLTCVVVEEELDRNRTGPPQTCKSLLLPGERLATSTQ